VDVAAAIADRPHPAGTSADFALAVGGSRPPRGAPADSLLYGDSGYAGVAFPKIDAALTARETGALTTAIGQAVDALESARAALLGARSGQAFPVAGKK
jgi:hypothetical protein